MTNGSENNPENIVEKTEEMKRYEKETNKYATWRGVITEGFKKWQKGNKIYNQDRERISLYVSEEIKAKWQEFAKENNYSTISKLIRESVNSFIRLMPNSPVNNFSSLSPQKISSVSHALKEPLTSIKGNSQLILENYKDKLNAPILETIKNIFDQSSLLESKIIQFIDNIKTQSNDYEILLIEDDLATIRLIKSYFESKGYICKGVVSGSKGIEELKNTTPKVILLDVILPDLSGFEICKAIKSDKEYKKIPVFFLTAIAGSEVEKNLKETRADGYILKPFNFSDFDIIFDVLNK